MSEKFKHDSKLMNTLVGGAILHLMVAKAPDSEELMKLFNISPRKEGQPDPEFIVNVSINGIEVPFESLIDKLYRDMDWMAEKKAKTIFKEKYYNTLCKVESTVDAMKEFVKSKFPEMFERD